MNDAGPLTPSRTVVRRASIAGFLGTVVESYDFFVFTYLIVYTSPLFFPRDDPAAGILISLAVLGTGFLARPLGGIIFGRLGDLHGRRTALLVTILGMGAATFLMGLLPTYQQIGIVSPILLVLLRLLQGISAGGELMGSATFISEHANKRNHGFLSTITPLGFATGTVLAPGVVALVTIALSEETMAEWGWRIPLLLSLLLTTTCLLLRLRLEDSPEFRRLADAHEVSKSPVRELISSHWRTLIKIVVLSATVLMIGYISAAYIPIYLQRELNFRPGTTANMATVTSAFAIAFLIVTGLVMDRFGRRATMTAIMAALGIGVLPIMYLMKVADGNPVITVLAWSLFAGLAGAASAPAYATFTAVFPVRMRYTGAAMGFGLGSAIGGGFGPYLAGQLTVWTGNPYAPAFMVGVAAIVAIVIITTIPSRGIVDDDGRMDGKQVDRNAAGSQLTGNPEVGANRVH